MATNNFISAVWSAKILEALHAELVYNRLFNRDYEGEIAQKGDTVHIAGTQGVTVKAYTKDAEIDDPERVKVEDLTLTVDQAEYFNIAVDDVNAMQTAVNLLDNAAAEAGYGFAEATDKYLAGVLSKAATFTNTAATATAVSKDTAYQIILGLKLALDKAKCPNQGRIAIVPPEFEAAMRLDPRFVEVGTQQSNERLEGTPVFRVAGMEVAVSLNVPSAKKGGSGDDKDTLIYDIIASCDRQGTYADQINKVEAYRQEKGFSDGVKGLHVYGAACLRPAIVAGTKVTL